jgi:hypothetical protein
MPSMSRRAHWVGPRIGIAVVLLSALLLSSACGGQDAASTAPEQPGTNAAVGAAPVSPTASEAAQRAAEVARAVATAQATLAAQAQASSVNPCQVVTKEELEAALGTALHPGQRSAGKCGYKAQADPNPGTMPSVTVTVLRARSAPTTYDTLRETASSRAMDVAGLGEKAYVVISSGLIDTRELQVLQGDVLVAINLTANLNPPVTMSEDEKRTRLIALARTALSRL